MSPTRTATFKKSVTFTDAQSTGPVRCGDRLQARHAPLAETPPIAHFRQPRRNPSSSDQQIPVHSDTVRSKLRQVRRNRSSADPGPPLWQNFRPCQFCREPLGGHLHREHFRSDSPCGESAALCRGLLRSRLLCRELSAGWERELCRDGAELRQLLAELSAVWYGGREEL